MARLPGDEREAIYISSGQSPGENTVGNCQQWGGGKGTRQGDIDSVEL